MTQTGYGSDRYTNYPASGLVTVLKSRLEARLRAYATATPVGGDESTQILTATVDKFCLKQTTPLLHAGGPAH